MIEKITLLTAQAHEWDVDQLTGPAGPWADFGYPGDNRAGLQLDFLPFAGRRWVGAFAERYQSPPAVAGLVAAVADPNKALVVAGGSGYLVNVLSPEEWSSLDCFPVVCAAEAPQMGLILLADFISVFAYGASGLRWRTGQVSWDGVQNLSVVGSQLDGEAWDAPEQKWVPFRVNLQTGRHSGGAAPIRRPIGLPRSWHE